MNAQYLVSHNGCLWIRSLEKILVLLCFEVMMKCCLWIAILPGVWHSMDGSPVVFGMILLIFLDLGHLVVTVLYLGWFGDASSLVQPPVVVQLVHIVPQGPKFLLCMMISTISFSCWDCLKLGHHYAWVSHHHVLWFTIIMKHYDHDFIMVCATTWSIMTIAD